MTQFPDALIVLGMHRSGTSTLMGLCKLLGVDIGDRLFPPRDDNPKGFFEHYDLIHLNEAVFEHFKLTSQDIFYFPDDWLSRPAIQDLRAQMIAVIKRDFSESNMWGLKDPRLTLLMPLWLSIFEELNCKPRFLIPFRHPFETAASLTKRDGISERRGLVMWLRANLELERHTRNFPRAFIYYPDLLKRWDKVLLDASKRVGLNWKQQIKTAAPEAKAFLDGELRHHDSHKQKLPGWAEALFALLQQAANGKVNEKYFDGLSLDVREIILTAQETLNAIQPELGNWRKKA